jgi:hypothetical protein
VAGSGRWLAWRVHGHPRQLCAGRPGRGLRPLSDLAATRIRGVITGLANNPFIATLYFLAYVWACYAVYHWNVPVVFRVIVGIVLVLICPNLQDLVDVWRGRPPRI